MASDLLLSPAATSSRSGLGDIDRGKTIATLLLDVMAVRRIRPSAERTALRSRLAMNETSSFVKMREMPPVLRSIGRALPSNYYRQEILSLALWNAWSGKVTDRSRFGRIHRSLRVRGRHVALPMEKYRALDSFGKANDKWVERAADLGEQAVVDALTHADLSPHDIDHIFFTTVKGIAYPSIDAKLVNQLSTRADIKRTPIFGLGCFGGAAGIARAADYLRRAPELTALLVSVELCSLTLQHEGNLLSYSPGRSRNPPASIGPCFS